MKYFSGQIGGMKLSDFELSKLVNLEKYEERLSVVQEIIGGDSEEFLSEYFSNYFNVSPSIDGELSEEDAVCNIVSLFGTYLLSSKDIESERKVEYRFWKSMRDFRKSDEHKKQMNESQLSNGEDDSRASVIDMFYDNKNKNFKKPKDIKVTAKDIKNSEHIAGLQTAIKYVKSEIGEKNIKAQLKESLKFVNGEKERAIIQRVLSGYDSYMKKYVASMKEDQLTIKKSIDQPIEFDDVLKDSGFPIDWTKIDVSNRKVFICLMENLYKRDIMNEDGIEIVAYDLHHFLLNGANLSDREKEVVKLFSIGMEQKKISDAMGITKSTMQVYMNRIHDKVIKSGYTIE